MKEWILIVIPIAHYSSFHVLLPSFIQLTKHKLILRSRWEGVLSSTLNCPDPNPKAHALSTGPEA